MTSPRKPLSEFEIIARYFASEMPISPSVELGIGDDCAVLAIPEGRRLAVSIDTAVEGRHFPRGAPAEDVAYRSAAAAASDLAAMGAAPVAATLALTLPDADHAWLESFSRGFKQAMQDFGFTLMGGDTTRGPLTITVQVHGFVPDSRALLRNGARAGDRVFVSGSLGDAAAALLQFDGRLQTNEQQADYLYQRFYRPQPRLALGQALLPFAHGAIDISDGLLADLGHIAERSGVAANLHIDRIPLSDTLAAQPDREAVLRLALTGGDDYELCFTVAADHVGKLEAVAKTCRVRLTEIGSLVEGSGVHCLDSNGYAVAIEAAGYQHF